MAVRTAKGIYGMQNKLIHQGLSQIGVPYVENKGFWVPIFKEIAGREIKGMSDLTLRERHEVIEHCRHRGVDLFNPRVPKKVSDWKKGDPDELAGIVKRPMGVSPAKRPLLEKIHAILADMKLPWKYVDGIAQKRFGVTVVEWCTVRDLRKVTQMMAVHQKRVEKREMDAERRAG